MSTTRKEPVGRRGRRMVDTAGEWSTSAPAVSVAVTVADLARLLAPEAGRLALETSARASLKASVDAVCRAMEQRRRNANDVADLIEQVGERISQAEREALIQGFLDLLCACRVADESTGRSR